MSVPESVASRAIVTRLHPVMRVVGGTLAIFIAGSTLWVYADSERRGQVSIPEWGFAALSLVFSVALMWVVLRGDSPRWFEAAPPKVVLGVLGAAYLVAAIVDLFM